MSGLNRKRSRPEASIANDRGRRQRSRSTLDSPICPAPRKLRARKDVDYRESCSESETDTSMEDSVCSSRASSPSPGSNGMASGEKGPYIKHELSLESESEIVKKGQASNKRESSAELELETAAFKRSKYMAGEQQHVCLPKLIVSDKQIEIDRPT